MSSNHAFHMITAMKHTPHAILLFSIVFVLACRPSEKLNVPQRTYSKMDTLETYIYKNVTQKYGMNIKYKYRYDHTLQSRMVPPLKAFVKPYVKFIQQYWVQPYLTFKTGKSYFETYAPNELILSATSTYRFFGEPDVLGFASGGTVVLVGEVNGYDLKDRAWTNNQLYVLTHEFGHTHHQVFGFPTEWRSLSQGHDNRLQPVQALRRGFVTAYAAHNQGEDFAETVAQLLFSPTSGLSVLVPRDCNSPLVGKRDPSSRALLDPFLGASKGDCEQINSGRETVKRKINAMKKFYQEHGNLDLEELRDSMRVAHTPLLYAR